MSPPCKCFQELTTLFYLPANPQVAVPKKAKNNANAGAIVAAVSLTA